MKTVMRIGLVIALDLALRGLLAVLLRLEPRWPNWPEQEDWP